jgi:hypothetical protein
VALGETKENDMSNDKDLLEGMRETAADDAKDAKTNQSAAKVKTAHSLVQEANLLLSAARRETATHDIIRAELGRVVEVCDLIKVDARAALKALDR